MKNPVKIYVQSIGARHYTLEHRPLRGAEANWCKINSCNKQKTIQEKELSDSIILNDKLHHHDFMPCAPTFENRATKDWLGH